MSGAAGERLTPARLAAVLGVLAALLAASVAAAVTLGSVALRWSAALDFSQPPNPDFVILFRSRLPRVLLGAAVGGGLGAAGAALQALLRNPLASPDVIGVSGGASVGAVLALALGGAHAWLLVPPAASAGSLLAIGLIVRLSTVRGRMNPYSLLLVGVVVNTIAAALVMIVTSLLDSVRAQGALFWLSGSLAENRWGLVAGVAATMAAAAAVLWSQARALNVLALGEETAAQLGTDVARVRRTTFIAAALAVGSAVSVAGVIGFVGLLVPHCLRLAIGSDQRVLLPASFLGGAAFLVWADTVARVGAAPLEIPVGAVTALCGGPFFVYLLRREQRASGV